VCPDATSCIQHSSPIEIVTVKTLCQTTIPIFLVFLISSCSPNQQINKRTAQLHNTLLGKWEVNKRSPKPGNNLVRPRQLLKGSIVFYPDNRFMYKNKYGRYTGTWNIISNSNWPAASSEGEHINLPYGVHKLSLSFDDGMPVIQSDVTMEMMYARKNKMKFTDYISVNKFKR